MPRPLHINHPGRKLTKLICAHQFKQHLWGADFKACSRCGARNPNPKKARERKQRYDKRQAAAIGEIRDAQWHLDHI